MHYEARPLALRLIRVPFTQGLLRQYLPKGSDLSGFTQEALDAIAWKLNTRPRKSLGFKCPAEGFTPDAFDFRPHHAALFALGP